MSEATQIMILISRVPSSLQTPSLSQPPALCQNS